MHFNFDVEYLITCFFFSSIFSLWRLIFWMPFWYSFFEGRDDVLLIVQELRLILFFSPLSSVEMMLAFLFAVFA